MHLDHLEVGANAVNQNGSADDTVTMVRMLVQEPEGASGKWLHDLERDVSPPQTHTLIGPLRATHAHPAHPNTFTRFQN